MALTENEILTIEKKAQAIRGTIIEMLVAAGSGHTAGPLGMADIFAAFYFHILKHDPKNPAWEARDRLVFSYAIFDILESEGLVHDQRALDGRVQARTASGALIEVRMPVFDARHVVAWDRPVELADALESWLASLRPVEGE